MTELKLKRGATLIDARGMMSLKGVYLDFFDLLSLLRYESLHDANDAVSVLLENDSLRKIILNWLLERDRLDDINAQKFRGELKELMPEIAKAYIVDLFYVINDQGAKIASMQEVIDQMNDSWPKSHEQYKPKAKYTFNHLYLDREDVTKFLEDYKAKKDKEIREQVF